jgi:hypothetical protein
VSSPNAERTIIKADPGRRLPRPDPGSRWETSLAAPNARMGMVGERQPELCGLSALGNGLGTTTCLPEAVSQMGRYQALNSPGFEYVHPRSTSTRADLRHFIGDCHHCKEERHVY